jgi:hypothetical protein
MLPSTPFPLFMKLMLIMLRIVSEGVSANGRSRMGRYYRVIVTHLVERGMVDMVLKGGCGVWTPGLKLILKEEGTGILHTTRRRKENNRMRDIAVAALALGTE